MEPTAKFGDAFHQSFWQTPDVGFLSHCLTDDCNQFIGGKSFVVSHMVNSGWNRFCQQAIDYIAEISYTCKRPAVLECPQRPRNALLYDAIKQIEVSLIARAVNHTGPHYVNLLAWDDGIAVIKIVVLTRHGKYVFIRYILFLSCQVISCCKSVHVSYPVSSNH